MNGHDKKTYTSHYTAHDSDPPQVADQVADLPVTYHDSHPAVR